MKAFKSVLTSPTFLASGLFIAVAATVAVLARKEPVSIALEPAEAELVGVVHEGEPAKVTLSLVNVSPSAAEIAAVSLSCGCMSLTTKEQRAVEAGFVIPANTRIPIELTIATAGLTGQRLNTVTIEGSSGNGAWAVRGTVKLEVASGIRAEPYELIVRDVSPSHAPIVKTIAISDGRDDPGVALSQVTTSDPSRVEARLEKVATSRVLENGLRHRYDIHATIHPARSPDPTVTIEEFSLRVFTEDQPDAPLSIPIICQYRSAELAMHPNVVVLAAAGAADSSGSESQQVTRQVLIKTRDEVAGSLEVLAKPAFVEAYFDAPGEKERRLTISWRPKDVPSADVQIPALVVGSPEKPEDLRCELRFVHDPVSRQ